MAMNEPPNPEVAVFAAALELPADQRGAYLDQACAGNADLRQRVEALLRVEDEAGNFFEKIASVARPTGTEKALPGSSETMQIPGLSAVQVGDHIGSYKLLQQIGEGGCGVVYMAEQEEPVRRWVALKVIKLGMPGLGYASLAGGGVCRGGSSRYSRNRIGPRRASRAGLRQWALTIPPGNERPRGMTNDESLMTKA